MIVNIIKQKNKQNNQKRKLKGQKIKQKNMRIKNKSYKKTLMINTFMRQTLLKDL